VDDELRAKLDEALKAANVAVTRVEMEHDALRFLVANTDTQIKARDVIQKNVGPNYVVALNLVPNSPHWMQAIGSKPMYLGLDLRGGVHFLLQVDMNAVKGKLSSAISATPVEDARKDLLLGPHARRAGIAS
jgi:preprotein translocase subunit SecD